MRLLVELMRDLLPELQSLGQQYVNRAQKIYQNLTKSSQLVDATKMVQAEASFMLRLAGCVGRYAEGFVAAKDD